MEIRNHTERLSPWANAQLRNLANNRHITFIDVNDDRNNLQALTITTVGLSMEGRPQVTEIVLVEDGQVFLNGVKVA